MDKKLYTDSLKTPEGTWLDWRNAWRDMGRTEEDIAAQERAREMRYAAQEFVFGEGAGEAQARRRARVRERLHGFTRKRFDARCERLARLSGYIVKALLRGWRRDPLSARELFRMAWARCVGAQLGSEAMARAWKDVWEWVRNIYLRIARERGIEAQNINVSECYLQSYSQCRQNENAENLKSSDGTGARDCKTGKRPVKQCTPLTADAVCGLYGDFRESASPSNKGNQGYENADGENARKRTSDNPTKDTPERIPRYKGKLPGRCCWKVWEAMERLEAVHWDATEHMWSAKHAFTWLASLLAAGKSLRAAEPLYYETLVSWYGRRVSQEANFVPSGMFAQLYREALHLPDFRSERSPRPSPAPGG